MMTFEVNDKEYELKYNVKRVDMIEAVTKMPLMTTLTQNGGTLTRIDLVNYIAYGIKENGSDVFVSPKEGKELAEELIISEGYAKCLGMVLETIQEDCGFFFQGA